MDKRDSRTLGECIQRFIAQDSTIYSDQWPAYNSFFSSQESFHHETVNHSQNFLNPRNNLIHTQGIESLWSSLKRFLRNRNLRNRNNLENYLGEFSFKKNTEN